jgi:hypothetical protein
MFKKVALGILAGGFLMVPTLASYADQHDADEVPGAAEVEVNCIDTFRIKTTRVIDNQTVIFEMRGGPDYMMTTINRCPGLKMHRTIMYEPLPSRSLCSVDTIRVPITTVGGLSSSNFVHCPIDKFVEYQEPEQKVQ